MISRLSQISRHLSRSAPNFNRLSATATSGFRTGGLSSRIMASADENNKKTIHTAACLIIGDEVLGGKTTDTNSAYMAKWCFSLGINLKRVEVIEDDEDEIVEAVRRMSDRYDFVVTSGGIGPTHDDITYQSIAKAFGLKLILHDEAYARMKKLSRPNKAQPNFSWDVDSPAKTARLRMVRLPIDESRELSKQVIFTRDDLWVPISVANGNIHILPGVPKLFESLLEGVKPFVVDRLVDPDGKGIARVIISTPLPESAVADYLTELAGKVAAKGVKVGSYPRWGKKNNTITLVGRDRDYLESLVPEVVTNVKGRRIHVEGEDDDEPEAAS
ncbi:molybdopterin binding domain-containing protein [Hypoxylon trugodes]|uniref:molybdopterin binding domain-containing protein n=1 Tax=Hypoxylon trugodes TaxID=326681 RepID=UPI00218F2630|nr:molybdopterin binding domain-containing protein [Hypoxylon trugodes]KAI1386662.1 molybdopterin binding domain-containing protein [Hypoxylon trugodes]